jgi:hypothetical protein
MAYEVFVVKHDHQIIYAGQTNTISGNPSRTHSLIVKKLSHLFTEEVELLLEVAGTFDAPNEAQKMVKRLQLVHGINRSVKSFKSGIPSWLKKSSQSKRAVKQWEADVIKDKSNCFADFVWDGKSWQVKSLE